MSQRRIRPRVVGGRIQRGPADQACSGEIGIGRAMQAVCLALVRRPVLNLYSKAQNHGYFCLPLNFKNQTAFEIRNLADK